MSISHDFELLGQGWGKEGKENVEVIAMLQMGFLKLQQPLGKSKQNKVIFRKKEQHHFIRINYFKFAEVPT